MMERFIAEFHQFSQECTCYFLMQRKPNEGKYTEVELELGIECQGPVQNILLLCFIQGIFKSCWASATTAVASTYSRTELDVGVVLC